MYNLITKKYVKTDCTHKFVYFLWGSPQKKRAGTANNLPSPTRLKFKQLKQTLPPISANDNESHLNPT